MSKASVLVVIVFVFLACKSSDSLDSFSVSAASATAEFKCPKGTTKQEAKSRSGNDKEIFCQDEHLVPQGSYLRIKDGKVVSKGNFIDGKQDGKWLLEDWRTGCEDALAEIEFRNGKPISDMVVRCKDGVVHRFYYRNGAWIDYPK